MGGIFTKLLNRLHGIFNKDAKKIPVISVVYGGGSCLITVSNYTLVAVSTGGTVNIDLSTITLSDLVTALDAEVDYTVTLLNAEYGTKLARGLIENPNQDMALDANLQYPTSLLWAELNTYGYALKETLDDIVLAEKQLYLDKTSGVWLDEWGLDYFGIKRETGETDAIYLARVINETSSLRLNNMALAKLMEGLVGFYVDVLDIGHFAQNVFYSDALQSTTDTLEDVLFDDNVSAAIVVSGFGVYFSQDISGLTTDEKNIIKSVIARNKAAGKVAQYFIPDGGGWQEIIL